MTAPFLRQRQPRAPEQAPLLRQHRDGRLGLLAEAANDPAQNLKKPETQLRAQLPPALPQPAPATPSVKQMPPTWLDVAQPWRAADSAYLAHWGQCPACKAAATGHADRCATGQHLHHAYLAALATT